MPIQELPEDQLARLLKLEESTPPPIPKDEPAVCPACGRRGARPDFIAKLAGRDALYCVLCEAVS